MSLLIDENVPDSVATFLRERGHAVHLSRDVLAQGTKDPVIARLGDSMTSIVVTFDKDFRKLASRVSAGERQRFRRLGRISLRCPAPRSLERVMKFIDAIEFHYQQALQQPGSSVSSRRTGPTGSKRGTHSVCTVPYSFLSFRTTRSPAGAVRRPGRT